MGYSARTGVAKQTIKGKRPVRTKPKAVLKNGGRKPKVDLGNTYGIKGSSRINVNKPGGLKGAVTQGSPRKNRFSVGNAKRLIRGGK